MNKTVALVAAYLASIVAAAFAITHVGTQYAPGAPHVVPVWPGIEAPSGVYVVGITLVLRDLLQRRVSKASMFGLIAVGAGLSALISPAVALASGMAFLASETVDFGVFSATERFGLVKAILASNAASIIVDSLVFLAVAFGSLAYLDGQIIGKAWATLAGVGILIVIRHLAAPRRRVEQVSV